MRGKITEYMRFYSYVNGKLNYDGLPRDEEFPATREEVGFWKRFQVERAINHARRGEATLADLNFLRRHGIFHSEVRYTEIKRREY